MRTVVLLAGVLVMSVLVIAGCGGGGSGGGGDGSASVNAPPIPTIEVNPASLTLPPGAIQQFTAIQVSPDGTKQDVTGSVTWSTSVASVADPNFNGNKGLVKSLAVGSAKITATTATGISGSATLAVVTLSSLAVTPAAPSLPAGIHQQLTATGTFADQSTGDLTSLVAWSSSNTAVATVNTSGMVTSVASGAATITATLAGVSGVTDVTVTTATLASLAIDQGNATIAIGTAMKFSGTGTYSDGSTHSVTTSATWTSSNPGVATIGNAPDSSGRVTATAVAPGTTTISAAFGGKTTSVTLTVTSAHLVSLVVAPETRAVGLGIETVLFTAIGTFSDNTLQDMTDLVTWTSSAPQFAAVSNDPANIAEATPVAVGTSTVTASTPTPGGVSATAVITVTPPEPTIVSISPTFGPTGQQVHVWGTNFIKDQTTVTVGGIAQVPTVVAHSGFLSFQLPAGATSPARVTVVTPKGSSAASADVITVGNPTSPPTIADISPQLGPVGQVVTVHGSNFIAGDTSVTIGGVTIAADVLDVNTLIFTVPTLPSGTVGPIRVSTTLGPSNDSTSTFTVGTPQGAPTVTSLDISFGPVGARIIVTGTNFVLGSTTINVGGVTGVPATVFDPTTLTFFVPAGMAGNTKVTVVTPKGSANSAEVFVLTKR